MEILNKFIEQVDTLFDSIHEIVQVAFESIMALAQVVNEILYEIADTSNETYKGLTEAIISVLQIPGIFGLEYERKLHRYRKEYKQSLKHFLKKHPIIRELLVAVLVEIILLIAGHLINNAPDYIDSDEAISYSM